jgi:ParB family chromosome partitioning protein
MAKKTGLGKGLDALFSTSIIEEPAENEVIHNLKISEVEPNKDQPRRVFEQESLNELSESIKKYGVIQPIIVSKKDDVYQIVAGERRWRASKIAGLTEIPAIIRDDDEQKNKEIALIENIQREDLNPIEKARGIKQLMEQYSMTQAQVAEVIGKGRSTVTNTLRILNLDSRVIDLALQGKLTEGHCKALLGFDNPDKQYDMALYMIESGDSVREAEKKTQTRKKMPKKNAIYEPIYRDIENSFQNFFGTKVKLNAGQRKGKIIIEYASNDDLERILELIK